MNELTIEIKVRTSSLAAAVLLVGFAAGPAAQALDKPGVVTAEEAETIAVVLHVVRFTEALSLSMIKEQK